MNAIPPSEDPIVCTVNRLPAHSDYQYYETKDEAEKKKYKWTGVFPRMAIGNFAIAPVASHPAIAS